MDVIMVSAWMYSPAAWSQSPRPIARAGTSRSWIRLSKSKVFFYLEKVPKTMIISGPSIMSECVALLVTGYT